MPKKYLVTFDRHKCIGALACTVAYPEKWIPNQKDGKVDLKGSKKKGKLFVLNITEKELEKFKASVQVCPVQAISVEEIK